MYNYSTLFSHGKTLILERSIKTRSDRWRVQIANDFPFPELITLVVAGSYRLDALCTREQICCSLPHSHRSALINTHTHQTTHQKVFVDSPLRERLPNSGLDFFIFSRASRLHRLPDSKL